MPPAYPDYYGAGAGMGMMPPAVAAPYAPVVPVVAPTPPVETSTTEDIYFTQSMDQVVKRVPSSSSSFSSSSCLIRTSSLARGRELTIFSRTNSKTKSLRPGT